MKRILRMLRKGLGPAILKRKKISGIAAARPAVRNGQQRPTVLRLDSGSSPWERLEAPWNQLWGDLFRGQRVLLKINLNTADPYPASTCPLFLHALLEFLHRQGAAEILVGDCASVSSLPTRKVAYRIRLQEAVAGLADLIYFDEMEWLEVKLPGQHLESVAIPAILHQVDRVINLTNMKTHRWADYSLALKAGVGYMHPMERAALHRDHLREKLAELNLAVMPDLSIIDGRVAMITGGPVEGATAEANIILLGDHPAALDLQAYQDLYRLKEKHHCLEHFKPNPLEMPQLQHASRLWPLVDWKDYTLLQY